MLKIFNKLIGILLIFSIGLYIVLFNQGITTIYFGPETSVSANTGAIVVFSFATGMIVMSVIALWFGLRGYFRERSFLARERERRIFYQNLLEARSQLASHEWELAKIEWQSAVKRDPTDILARVELSRSIEGMADGNQNTLREALKVLDAARAADPKNIEVLFRAAELNILLNNKTAALDNLALIVYNQPSQRALKMARTISEDLGRIGDALEYQRQLESLIGEGPEDREIISRLRFKALVQDHDGDTAALREKIKAFIKKNPECAPAIDKIAELESSAGRHEEAAQLYIRLAKLTNSPKPWHQAAKLLLKNNSPEKAISAAKAATNDSTGIIRIRAEIEVIRLFIALSMLDEAKRLCDGFPFLVRRENLILPPELNRIFLSLRGLCLTRMGEHRQAAEMFKKLCEEDIDMQELLGEVGTPSLQEPPAPRLSTP